MQRRIVDGVDRACGWPQADFPTRLHLPPESGKGLPARVVELRIARLSYRHSVSVLDVGQAFARRSHLHMLRSLPEPREMDFRHTFGPAWAQAEWQELRYVGYYDQANAGAGAIPIAHITKAHDGDGRPA